MADLLEQMAHSSSAIIDHIQGPTCSPLQIDELTRSVNFEL
jgi:hypothetical protein